MCVPLFGMIRRWVFEGVLEDPGVEFFVVATGAAATTAGSATALGLSGSSIGSSSVVVDSRDLWRDAYKLEPAKLPPFISRELAQTILRAGKSINFLRDACGDARWLQDWAPVAAGAAAALGYGQVRMHMCVW